MTARLIRPRALNEGPGFTALAAATYRIAFAVLYCLGLRVGEVSRLQLGDVDLNAWTLVVRRTKFGKDRLVPFGPRLARELAAYLAIRRRGRMSGDAAVFPGVRGAALSTNSMRRIFRRLCREVGIGASESGAPPRVHDLRHSFAVSTLLHWYEAGINPTGKLLQLSTFLGHSKIKATAVYLTITWELLREARSRFARLAAMVIPEVAS